MCSTTGTPLIPPSFPRHSNLADTRAVASALHDPLIWSRSVVAKRFVVPSPPVKCPCVASVLRSLRPVACALSHQRPRGPSSAPKDRCHEPPPVKRGRIAEAPGHGPAEHVVSHLDMLLSNAGQPSLETVGEGTPTCPAPAPPDCGANPILTHSNTALPRPIGGHSITALPLSRFS